METSHRELEHTVSWKTLARIVVMGVLVFLAWEAVGIFIDILIALILATALYPIVKKLSRKIPHLISTILVFLALLVPFVLVAVFVVPAIVREMPGLLDTFYLILQHSNFLPASWRAFDLTAYLNQHASYFLESTATVALEIVSVITIFFLMFYFVLDSERLLDFFLTIFPPRERKKIRTMLLELAHVNGRYIRGNIVISLICFAFVFAVLKAIGIPFALPLAIFAGIIDLLPLVGSTLGAIPSVIIAFSLSPLKGVLVLAIHLFYQQTENAVIAPAIYNKALNISPALSFISVVIGAGIFGIVGAFLALPVAASIPVLLRYAHGYSERNE